MKTERPPAHWNRLNESELTGGMEHTHGGDEP